MSDTHDVDPYDYLPEAEQALAKELESAMVDEFGEMFKPVGSNGPSKVVEATCNFEPVMHNIGAVFGAAPDPGETEPCFKKIPGGILSRAQFKRLIDILYDYELWDEEGPIEIDKVWRCAEKIEEFIEVLIEEELENRGL